MNNQYNHQTAANSRIERIEQCLKLNAANRQKAQEALPDSTEVFF